MRILIATDAWRPQINGVVRTYERLQQELSGLGTDLHFVTPNEFRTIGMPTYREIRLSIPKPGYVAERVRKLDPHCIHIATEGPIGLMMRSFCQRQGRAFTTSFHTRFPEYLADRLPIPLSWSYAAQRWFHNAGAGMMVATQSLQADLAARGFRNILPWARGVDTDQYRPRDVRLFGEGPVFIYVGRVSVEKNIEAFLQLDLPGRKVVVGAGPQLAAFKASYPDVLFTGRKVGEDLAECYASGDVFVFPSRTDTFGLVQLEAMASGVPVAAFPVTGPIDVVDHGVSGALDEDLRAAAMAALALERGKVREHALAFSWRSTAELFLDNVAICNPTKVASKTLAKARQRQSRRQELRSGRAIQA